MLKNFVTADSARSGTRVSLDTSVSEELEKIKGSIQETIDQGEFMVEWKVPRSLNPTQINHILDFLVNREYAIFSKKENYELVKRFTREAPMSLKAIFEPEEIVFRISWKNTFEEIHERTNYFDWMNPQRSDLTSYFPF